MKYLKFLFFTLLFVLFNIIILLFLSKDFRNNFFDYLDSINHHAQMLGKSAYELINKSDSAPISSQKPRLEHASKSLPSKSNILSKVSNEESVVNNLNDQEAKEQIDKQKNQKFKIVENYNKSMSGNDGFMHIESFPENVSVIIDEQEIGKTPVTLRVNPPGLYKVVLKSENYETWQKTVHVYPSEVTKVNAKLNAGSGTLTILSDPQLADVRIDGSLKGKTPLTLKSITAGFHQIHISKGNLEYEGSVDILSEKKKILNVKLKVLRALVKVDSEPKGASIYIDGIKLGTTPAALSDVKIGSRQIVLIKGRNLAFVDSIKVYPERENTLFAILIDKKHYKGTFSSNLKIDSELNETIVRVNGITQGIIPLVLNNLRPGEHELFLVKSDQKQRGIFYFSKKIFIDPFETKEISVMSKDYKFKSISIE
jgi:hypothetical protein